MSLISGLRTGLRRGMDVNRAGSVVRDGPNGWYVPQTAADFADLALAAPDYLWLCQESSGNLASAIGSLTLTANATGHLYRQTVAGWGMKFLGTDGATASQGWTTTSALLDVAAGESIAAVCLASAAIPAASTRQIVAYGNGLHVGLSAPAGLMRTSQTGNSANGVIVHGGVGTVHQFCVYRNGTANVSAAVSDLETVSVTHAELALAGQTKGLGASAALPTPPSGRYGWLAFFKGANAEQNWPAYLATLRGA